MFWRDLGSWYGREEWCGALGGWLCALFVSGSAKEEGREERRNLMHVLEEDLDFVQLDHEFVTLLYLGRE